MTTEQGKEVMYDYDCSQETVQMDVEIKEVYQSDVHTVGQLACSCSEQWVEVVVLKEVIPDHHHHHFRREYKTHRYPLNVLEVMY